MNSLDLDNTNVVIEDSRMKSHKLNNQDGHSEYPGRSTGDRARGRDGAHNLFYHS